ncbi:MAG: protein kinase [Labilithrix sp.]|nr:protein kinase [Labilithrix sp.]
MSESSGAAGKREKQGRVGTVINDKWHVDARIGSGGMATVYAATHRNGHRAALKMLHAQLSRDPATRQRFLREAYVGNQVSHPGVVRVQDDDVTPDGAVFLILELLEGETLEARRIGMGGALPIDEILDIADQALDALAAAHDKGIIHRDVKPDNVFLTHEGVVKLLDFGLARMKNAQGETTKTGVTIGTPEFMPPEQASGKRDDVDARSDVWGLGATIYTSITGKYVHDASSLHAQLVASATLRARPVRELAPHVPASVAIVIDRALELDRKERWESAREMQRAFRAARGVPKSDDFTADSLTLPAASLRRVAPISERRPSGVAAVPSSARTLPDTVIAPPSDPTIEEAAPQVLLELPVSSASRPAPPTTERLTGPLAASGENPIIAVNVPATDARTLVSPGAPPSPGPTRLSAQPIAPTFTSTQPMNLDASGSLPHLAAPAAAAASAAMRASAPPLAQPPAAQPAAAPPAPPAPQEPGPASLRHRRSARVVVVVSVLLIVMCAGTAAFFLWRDAIPFAK